MEKEMSLTERYDCLVNRLENLNYIKDITYYNETSKLRRIRKLIRLTKRKVSILENHLNK